MKMRKLPDSELPVDAKMKEIIAKRDKIRRKSEERQAQGLPAFPPVGNHGFDSGGMRGTRFNPGDGTKADHP